MSFYTTQKSFSKVLGLFCLTLLACQLVQSASDSRSRSNNNKWMKLCISEKLTDGATIRQRFEACESIEEEERERWTAVYSEPDSYLSTTTSYLEDAGAKLREVVNTVKEMLYQPKGYREASIFTPTDYHRSFRAVDYALDCVKGDTCLVLNKEQSSEQADGMVFYFNGSETTYNSIVDKPTMIRSNAQKLNTQSGNNFTIGEYRVVPFDLLQTLTTKWVGDTRYTFSVAGKRVSDFLLGTHYTSVTQIPPQGYQLAYTTEGIFTYYGNVYNVIVGSKYWLCTTRHVKPQLVYFPPEVGSGYMPMEFVEFGDDLTCALTREVAATDASPVCKKEHKTCVLRFAYLSDSDWEHGEVPVTILKQTKVVGSIPLITGVTPINIRTGYSGSPCYATEAETTCVFAHLYGNNPVMNTAHLYRLRVSDFEE